MYALGVNGRRNRGEGRGKGREGRRQVREERERNGRGKGQREYPGQRLWTGELHKNLWKELPSY